MQVVSDNKLQQIVDELTQLDCDLQNINFDHNECQIRRLIDYRRQLLANLKSIQPINEAADGSPNMQAYTPTTFSIELVKRWRSRVMQAKPTQNSFENSAFCNQILDSVLPETWNFNSDVMVISAPPSNMIVKKAAERGQRHIVIYDHHKCINGGIFDYQSIAKIVVCQTITDVEITFAKLQSPAEQVINIPCSFDSKFLTATKSHLAEAIRKGKKNRIANTITANKFGESWSKNLLKNLPLIAKAPSIHQLSVKGVKDAVIVASGPSLNKNVHTLAKIQDQVFIVSALRSIQTLHEANVKPDLVIQLDAEDDHVAREFSTKLDIKIENFLVELTVNPWFLKSNAKNFIWSYPSIFDDISKHFGVEPTPFDAPSVAIYGLTLCYLLGFESLCFIGQDLASSDRSQYAKGATSLLPVHNDISTFNIEVDGFYNDKVMTRSAYHGQLLRCAHIASELSLKAPNVKLFNATEGGAYIAGFEHLSLSDFAFKRNLNRFANKKHLNFKNKPQVSKNELKKFLSQTNRALKDAAQLAEKIMSFSGVDKEICLSNPSGKKLLDKLRCVSSSCSFLQIAMQTEISSVTGTSKKPGDDFKGNEFFKQLERRAKQLSQVCEDALTRI